MWSTARVTHETDVAEGKLAKDVQDLLRAERDQGRSSPPARTILGRQALLCHCFCRALGRSWLLTELVKTVFVCDSLS